MESNIADIKEEVKRLYTFRDFELVNMMCGTRTEKEALSLILNKGRKRPFYEIQQELNSLTQNELQSNEEEQEKKESKNQAELQEEATEVISYSRLHDKVMGIKLNSRDNEHLTEEQNSALKRYKQSWKNMKYETKKEHLDNLTKLIDVTQYE